MKLTLKSFPFEASVWLVGLLTVMILNPADQHISICPFKNAGFEFCPGCGLGQSIGLLARGKFTESFHAHPLGIFAVLVISARIIQLIKKQK